MGTEEVEIAKSDAETSGGPENAVPASISRALIALSPAIHHSQRATGHQHAPFLAHLVAIKDQHPQTRERRRAEPDVVLAAYRATAALRPF